MNAILIHGAYGNGQENWFPWLKRELEKKGIKVQVPKFPTPEGQDLAHWLNVFADFEMYVDKETVMIGHSIGSAFILNYLERTDRKIRAAFLVSPFVELLDNPKYDSINKTFVDRHFDWEKIKKSSQKFFVIHGNKDPYVPAGAAKKVADNVGTRMKLIFDGGHFNKEAGFTEFPFLLDNILKTI